MRKHDNTELSVITKAKELLLYILAVTDRSPKKYRFTLVSRLQGYALDIVEYLYLANCIVISDRTLQKELDERIQYQRKAFARLRLLAYIAVIARESVCITQKQQRIISEKIVEVEKMLYAWRMSDEKRIKSFAEK